MDMIDFGDGVTTSIRHCGSDRPAFVLIERPAESTKGEEELEWREIIHAYPAMGLPRQHTGQQVLLAR